MKRLTLLGCALVVAANTASAQSAKDFAAWAGILLTPVGALPEIETTPGGLTGGSSQLAFRYSRWTFPGTDVHENNLGVSYFAPPSSLLRYGVTIGMDKPSGPGTSGSDNLYMFGGELSSALFSTSSASSPNSFMVDWKVNAGYGHASGSGITTAWSLVGQIPVRWRYQMANKSDVSAFASAGFGFAGTKDDISSENGTRPMYSLGAAWTSASGVGIHVGTQKILLKTGTSDGPPWNTGIALSVPLNSKK